MRRFGTIFLAALLMTLLVSCGASSSGTESGEEGGLSLYYVNASGNGLLSTPYTPAGADEVTEVFGVMKNGQFSDGSAAVPDSVSLDHVGWQEGCAVLYLKGEYPQVGTVEEILCRSALTQTLVQLEDVDGITILVDGVPLTDRSGMTIGVMQADSFLSEVTAEREEERVNLTLYFADESGDSLRSETVTLSYGTDTAPEELVLTELIAGPRESGHRAVLPADTQVISVQVKDEICYVNLDESVTEGNLPVDGLLSVYAVVNSLTGLDGIAQVQFQVNGTSDVTLGDKVSLASPFERNPDLIGD